MNRHERRAAAKKQRRTDQTGPDWEWRYNELLKGMKEILAKERNDFERRMHEAQDLADLAIQLIRPVITLTSIATLAPDQVLIQAVADYGPDIETAYHTLMDRAASYGPEYQAGLAEYTQVHDKIQALCDAVTTGDPDNLAVVKTEALELDRHLPGIAALMGGPRSTEDKTDG